MIRRALRYVSQELKSGAAEEDGWFPIVHRDMRMKQRLVCAPVVWPSLWVKIEQGESGHLYRSGLTEEEAPGPCSLYGPPGSQDLPLPILLPMNCVNIRDYRRTSHRTPGDLMGFRTNLEPGDVCLLTRSIGWSKTVEEVLYPAMEDRSVDIADRKDQRPGHGAAGSCPLHLGGGHHQGGHVDPSPLRIVLGCVPSGVLH